MPSGPPISGAVRVKIRLVPRAGRDGVDAVSDGALRVRVAAPPVDGAANEALARLLAATLGVSRTSVRVVGGARARTKVVEIDGVGAAALAARWPGLGVSSAPVPGRRPGRTGAIGSVG